jgi:hypothetical protein
MSRFQHSYRAEHILYFPKGSDNLQERETYPRAQQSFVTTWAKKVIPLEVWYSY